MAQKKAAAVAPIETVDLEPVELDPPAPELVRWQELADKTVDVHHDGDVAKITATPRPKWSEPLRDHVGESLFSSYYNSDTPTSQ